MALRPLAFSGKAFRQQNDKRTFPVTNTLVQPILSAVPEPGHDAKATLPISEFLALLREEEDYFSGEQHRTKLMISRLRKIFYDQWGWNSQLIRDAADVEMRYLTQIVDDPTTHSREIVRYQAYAYQPKHRVVTYRPDDRVYGNTRVGQTPFIYQNDHQEVLLEEGWYCDIAHILAGLDARNHLEPVSPLPNFLMFMKNLFPHVDSNMDIVTWLGDIASSSGDFLFDYLREGKKRLTTEQEQAHINVDAPGSDMLGDIEPYVIGAFYDVSATENGPRVTDVLADYFSPGNLYRKQRAALFCQQVGLKNWDGERFSNEKDWLIYYKKQLRDNITFQVFSLTNEKLRSVWLPIVIWFGAYKGVLKYELLLEIFLKAMKEIIKQETSQAL